MRENIQEGNNGHERQIVMAIENSKLSSNKKLDLALLIIDKNKKVAQMGNFKIFEGEKEGVKETIKSEFEEEFRELTKLFKELNLKYKIVHDLKEKDGIYGYSILVSQNEGSLSEAVMADTTNNDTRFGQLMGYPQTAIDSYNSNNAIDDATYYLVMQDKKELESFLTFKPSKQHYQEELEVVQRNHDYIKIHYPQLYKEVEKDYR